MRLSLLSLAGPLLWTVHFAVLFLLEGFICVQPAMAPEQVPRMVGGTTLVIGAICLWLVIAPGAWLNRFVGIASVEPRSLLVAVTRWLAVLSLLAIAWAGLGALFVGVCSVAY